METVRRRDRPTYRNSEGYQRKITGKREGKQVVSGEEGGRTRLGKEIGEKKVRDVDVKRQLDEDRRRILYRISRHNLSVTYIE